MDVRGEAVCIYIHVMKHTMSACIMAEGGVEMPHWLEVALRTLLALVVLFILTKALGKRQISQLSLF